MLGGDTVAHGYLGEPGLAATPSPSTPTGCGGSAPTTSATSTTTGLLVIDGRADDVIITGGLKINPGVVEDAMTRHLDDVLDVVVLGLPDPEWGESVCAAVTLLDPTGHLTTREVRERLRGILPERPCRGASSCSPPSPSAARASPTAPPSGTRCRSARERWQDGGTTPRCRALTSRPPGVVHRVAGVARWQLS